MLQAYEQQKMMEQETLFCFQKVPSSTSMVISLFTYNYSNGNYTVEFRNFNCNFCCREMLPALITKLIFQILR